MAVFHPVVHGEVVDAGGRILYQVSDLNISSRMGDGVGRRDDGEMGVIALEAASGTGAVVERGMVVMIEGQRQRWRGGSTRSRGGRI